MTVGVMIVQMNLHGIGSLKDKRSIVKSVIGRLKSRFNASVAEVAHHDSRQQADVGISIVSNDTQFLNQQFEAIINFMQKDGRFFLGPTEREMFYAGK
jgi:uncharacterized protein